VRPYLDADPAIDHWEVDTSDPGKILTVTGEGVSPDEVQRHVARAGFKVLSRLEPGGGAAASPPALATGRAAAGQDAARPAVRSDNIPAAGESFLATYHPLLLILAYLVGLVALVELRSGAFSGMRAMANFMGGFFVAFSFFKLLNLRGFVDAYQTYDLLARPLRAYGYAYPFVELGLGIAHLSGYAPVTTNAVTLLVMLLSLAGVTQALLQKRSIQCACLGTVFNLPMTKVTFLEDALMAAMAAAMLVRLL
jgi:hypothetical protein